MAAAMMVVVAITARRRNFPVEPPVPRGERPRILARALLPLGMPVVLLGGIYGGVFTPTEAAAVAALYALVLAGVVYRELTAASAVRRVPRDRPADRRDPADDLRRLRVNYAVDRRAARQGARRLDRRPRPVAARLPDAVNLLFLVLGCFLDATTMLLVLVPVLLPTVAALGIDLVYFGVVIVFNIIIGLVTPPYGLLLFVLSALTRIPLGEIIRECWALIGSMIVALALLVALPRAGDVAAARPRLREIATRRLLLSFLRTAAWNASISLLRLRASGTSICSSTQLLPRAGDDRGDRRARIGRRHRAERDADHLAGLGD